MTKFNPYSGYKHHIEYAGQDGCGRAVSYCYARERDSDGFHQGWRIVAGRGACDHFRLRSKLKVIARVREKIKKFRNEAVLRGRAQYRIAVMRSPMNARLKADGLGHFDDYLSARVPNSDCRLKERGGWYIVSFRSKSDMEKVGFEIKLLDCLGRWTKAHLDYTIVYEKLPARRAVSKL